jgi:HEAT repeat protein
MITLLLALLLQDRPTEEERAENALQVWKSKAGTGSGGGNALGSFSIPVIDKVLVPAMVGMLDDPKPEIRCYAMEKGLVEVLDRSAIPKVITLLDDGDVSVRKIASFTLRRLNAREGIPALLARLKTAKNHDELHFYIYGLSGLEAKEAVPALIKLCDDKDIDIRRDAIDALARMADAQAEPTLLKLAKGPELSWKAVDGLILLRSTKLLPLLPPYLKDPPPRNGLRIVALKAYAALGSTEQRSQVLPLLKDPDHFVQEEALKAIGSLGLKEATADVSKFLTSAEPSVRSAALDALGRLGAQECLPAVSPLLSDSESYVRGSAVRALGRLGGPKAQEALKGVFAVFDGQLKMAAASELIRSGNTDIIPLLLKLPEGDWRDRAFLYSLNSLRQRELWDRLQKARLKKLPKGTVAEVFDQLAKEAGLKVQAPPAVRGRDRLWTCRRYDSYMHDGSFPLDRRPLGDLIGEIGLSEGRETCILLEGDALKLVEPEEAAKFWRWWCQEQEEKK